MIMARIKIEEPTPIYFQDDNRTSKVVLSDEYLKIGDMIAVQERITKLILGESIEDFLLLLMVGRQNTSKNDWYVALIDMPAVARLSLSS